MVIIMVLGVRSQDNGNLIRQSESLYASRWHNRCHDTPCLFVLGVELMTMISVVSAIGLEIKKSRVRIPPGAQEKLEFFRVKKVVLTTRCRCAQPPVCIRTHTKYHVRTLKIL